MAKYKKIMPPRNAVIRGQDHLLAYITPQEAEILRSRGGSGDPGPMGIPAYFTDDDEAGAGDFGMGPDGSEDSSDTFSDGDDFDAGLADTTGAIEGVDFGGGGASDGITAAQVAAMAKAQQNLPIKSYQDGLTPEERIAQSRFDYADVFGPEIYSPTIVGQDLGNLFNKNGLGGVRLGSNYMDIPSYRSAFANMAIDRIQDRIDGYNNDQSFLGQKVGPINSFFANNIKKGLEAGGRPVLDATGRVVGVFNDGPFGLGEVYTGMPVEGVAGTGYDNMGGGGISDDEEVKPVNPATGQCDEGYIFDDDLQACRLDTSGSRPDDGAGGVIPEDGAYARMGLLDVAPTGLAEFQDRYGAGFGTPQDFTAANMDFRRRGATYPEYFRRPPQLTGYTLLS